MEKYNPEKEIEKICEQNEITIDLSGYNKIKAIDKLPLLVDRLSKFVKSSEIKDILLIDDIGVQVEKKKIEKRTNPFKNLHYSTEHLKFYHEFSSLVGLYGRHYIPIIKARWYQLHGGILQKQIKLGSLQTDTRIQVCYPLVTEAGKNEIIYSIKSLVEKGIRKGGDILFKCVEPISFHQEALIGKRVEREMDNPKYLSGEVKTPRKIKIRVENRGHLDSDFVEFDECNQLMNSNSPDFQQAREYLSKAENPIGKNKVEKRSVDDLPEEAIAYCPVSSHSYYFQPFKKLPESFVLQGFGRRKFIPVGNIQNFLVNPTETLYSQKLQKRDFSKQEYEERIILHLETMRNKISQFTFTDKAVELINQLSLYIWGQAQIHSEKISNFAKVSKWTALENLTKMSCILAGSYYQGVVDGNFVLLAYMDLVELMQNTYDFIYERIYGDFDYGTTWGGADFKQREALKFLYDNKALSRSSSKISIAEFLSHIAEIYKVREAQARNRFYDMKEMRLVDSAQIGTNETRVWLIVNPEEHSTYLEGDKGSKGYTLYNSIFLSKNTLLSGLQSLSPLIPSNELEVNRIMGEKGDKGSNEVKNEIISGLDEVFKDE